MWTNLGYWAAATNGESGPEATGGSSHYTEAARALARRVGAAAQLSAGDVVVDYACGFGDSLRLWIEEFGAHRVVGVEPNPSVCQVIEARARSWGLADRIGVLCASAEEVAPNQASVDVTAVVCVDAAYHFRTRRSWLAELGASAHSGLRLGVADLCVPADRERSLRLRALARLMRIPRENLMSARSIAIACEDAGFTVNRCDLLGVEVLDGFVTQVPVARMSVAVTRAAILFARRARLLDYLVIGAER